MRIRRNGVSKLFNHKNINKEKILQWQEEFEKDDIKIQNKRDREFLQLLQSM